MCSPVRNGLMILIAGLLSAPAWATDYVQVAGSSLVFAGTYQGEVFTGRFPGFATHLSFDPAQLATSKLDVTIPLASATTANATACSSSRLLFINSMALRSFRGAIPPRLVCKSCK